MQVHMPSFAGIIAPLSPETFFADCWETKPLHLARANPSFYDGLLTKADAEAIISSGGLRFPAIQLARDGRFLPPEAFTRSLRSGDDIFAGVPNLDRVNAAYRSGATISLPGLHRAWRPLGLLVDSIQSEISHAVHTNAYLTPGNTAGFAPHYDTHDVFILQIAGKKTWRIHAPPLTLPHRSQTLDATPATSSRPILSVDLVPGDLLYLPRGFVHATVTSQLFSLHVTLGVTVYTWLELLQALLQTAKATEDFRRALPPGFARDGTMHPKVRTRLADLLKKLQETTDYDAVLAGFSERTKSAAPTTQQFTADIRAFSA